MDPVVRAASASGGGFQYTPPSYLLRASDTTNRPWNYNGSSSASRNNNNDGKNGDCESENEYDLPQEQRPQTRRESYVDAHFHQRVRTKQSRYRDIITGAEDIESTTETTSTERSERTTSSNKKPNPLKLRSISEPSTTSSNIDAETVRNLRAHRLRSSLLKPTSDDYDLQTKLELRRFQSRRKDDAAEQNERASLAARSDISERIALENERKVIQDEQNALAIAKEEASYALKRASQINEERRKQRELDAIIEMNRVEDEKRTKRREQQQRSRRCRRSSSKNNRSTMKTKSFTENENENDDDFTLFDLEKDFAFLNDISGIVRDSSLMKGCLSVTTGGCFGSTSTCNDLSSDCKDNIIDDNNNNNNNSTPDLVRCSDTSHSDIEGDENGGENNGGENNNGTTIIGEGGFGNVGYKNAETNYNGSSLRRSRLSAQYRV